MKNTQKVFATTVVVIISLVIIAGGVYFYLQNSLKKTPEVNSIVTLTKQDTKQTQNDDLKEKQTTIKDGNHFVFVKDIYKDKDNFYISFDKVELIDEGQRISNTNPLLRTLPIDKNADIELDRNNNGMELKKFTTDELWQYIKKYNHLEENRELVDHNTLFTDFLHKDEVILITVEKGLVTGIRFWWFAG